MMSFEFGGIVVVEFPFTNQQASKKRPLGCLGPADGSAVRRDISKIIDATEVEQ